MDRGGCFCVTSSKYLYTNKIRIQRNSLHFGLQIRQALLSTQNHFHFLHNFAVYYTDSHYINNKYLSYQKLWWQPHKEVQTFLKTMPSKKWQEPLKELQQSVLFYLHWHLVFHTVFILVKYSTPWQHKMTLGTKPTSSFVIQVQF